MHGPFEKDRKGETNICQSWSIKLVALPLLLLIALIGYIVSHPEVAKWVAEGVGAEPAGSRVVPEPTSPTKAAQPSNQARAVTAH